MLKKFILLLCLVFTPIIAQSSETCASMGVVAANYSSSAYQLTVDDPDAIDKKGFFDTWLMYLSLLFEKSEKEGIHSSQFFLAAKVAGNAITQEKDRLTKTLSSKGYEQLFPKIVVRSCEVIRAGQR